MNAWLFVFLLGQGAQSPPAPLAAPRAAQERRIELSGHVSALADVLPRRDAAELRPQAGVEITAQPSASFRLKFDGFVEGLVADRSSRVTAAIARVREAWFEVSGSKGDLRAGYGRLVWGRLDEVQPSDVINPLDTSRFLFDGRGAARLPVAFLRGRVFATEGVVVEGVLAPGFPGGTFDELDEDTSPFNLRNDIVFTGAPALSILAVREAAKPGWSVLSGGGRVLATVGRVDVGAGVYRGFESFRQIIQEPGEPIPLVAKFPRFTMLSADFETVTGNWAWRGEAALFVDKSFQGVTRAGSVKGKALDAGVGFDRRTGAYRVFASVILHREWSAEDAGIERTDASLVGSLERQFGRDRYLARAFAVVNPADASGFVRGLIVWRVRDDVAVEGSVAAFIGEGDDMLARFRTRDFLLTRIRWRF